MNTTTAVITHGLNIQKIRQEFSMLQKTISGKWSVQSMLHPEKTLCSTADVPEEIDTLTGSIEEFMRK